MHFSIPVFLSGFLAFQATFIMAQDPPQSPDSGSSTPSCTFSCPETDLLSWPLVKRPYTVGYNSYYTIFECVYSTNRSTPQDVITEHKCSYNKHTGSQALEAAGDNCRPQAIPCPSAPAPSDPSTPSSESGNTLITPAFSHIDNEEVVPWIEGGRYMLYLIEHPPS